MEPKWLYATIVLATLVAVFFLKKLLNNKTKSSLKLPPSPPRTLPILGHLHLLEPPMYKTLHKLSTKYGPIFSLQFGSRLAVVLSSPAAVEEAFTKNDAKFANRPHLTIHRHLGYNFTALVSSNYSEHWRNLRRLCSIDIFSPGRLNMFLTTREGEVKQLARNLYDLSSSVGFTSIELRAKIRELTFNNITRMVAGKKFYGEVEIKDKEAARDFQELIGGAFKFSGASNAGDFVPFLRRIDYAGIEKNMSIISKKMDIFLQGLVDELRKNDINLDETMIGHLLKLQKSQPDYYTDDVIKGLTLNMLIGGTNTSETTIEWAMSLLMNHPQVLKHARDEIDTHVGFNRLIEEQDLPKLKFLNKILSETFRLFPALPMLIPHESSENCKLGGYDVPAGTIILANAWAVHRDPTVWDEPDSFKPERFEGQEIEAHKLLPFGMGRRVCPGANMGQRVVGLALGSLIQNFEWKTLDGEKVDLTEGSGLTIPKANPLVVMCKPREEMSKVLQNLEKM
ncbi:hypothetical protein Leryth_013635 [Lithospermum erythrorhizon]|nr:hypothetical protein Leryth_013635 [Lithospermum erythrorhizon]